uniref:Putative secreted metalloprotease n=1 Tax=Ixodes ricinus TaxID=34613 RepID=A0A6B0VBL8_IXORI
MNAPKLRELLLLLLSASVSAAGESAMAQQQAECSGQETSETLYVGIYIATDYTFRSCSPYKNQTLEDYLRAFVGGVQLYFQELKYPTIQIVYQGSRYLKDDEESKVIGSVKGTTNTAVKGADALQKIEFENNEGEVIMGNTLFLVLTGLNVTEEETKNTVHTAMPIPDSSDTNDDEEYDSYSSEDMTVRARADTGKRLYDNVGGLSQYGSICVMAAAIVQDNGRNFSGVFTTAQQVANVLGPIYNGTIPKRKCEDYDSELPTFHGKECKLRVTLLEEKEKFSCLNESIDGIEGQVMTPYEFYEKNLIWTPCGTSYPGSEECQNPELTAYKHQNCSISCCLKSPFPFMGTTNYTIPAPDGEKCNPNKICIGGTCVTTNAILNEHSPKR